MPPLNAEGVLDSSRVPVRGMANLPRAISHSQMEPFLGLVQAATTMIPNMQNPQQNSWPTSVQPQMVPSTWQSHLYSPQTSQLSPQQHAAAVFSSQMQLQQPGHPHYSGSTIAHPIASSAQMLAARQQYTGANAVSQQMSHIPMSVAQQHIATAYAQQQPSVHSQIAASGIYNNNMVQQYALAGGYQPMMGADMLAAAAAGSAPGMASGAAQMIFAQQYAVAAAAAAAAAAVGSAQVPPPYYNMVLPQEPTKGNESSFKKKSQSARRSRAVRKYPCPDCGKMFVSMSKVARHVTVHTGDRRFKCEVCHTRFTQKSALTVHMRRHQPGGKDEHTVAGGVVVRDATGESVTCTTIPPAVDKIDGVPYGSDKLPQASPASTPTGLASDVKQMRVDNGSPDQSMDTESPKRCIKRARDSSHESAVKRPRGETDGTRSGSPAPVTAPHSRFHDSGFDSNQDDTATDTDDESHTPRCREKSSPTKTAAALISSPPSPPAIPAVQAPPRVSTPRASINRSTSDNPATGFSNPNASAKVDSGRHGCSSPVGRGKVQSEKPLCTVSNDSTNDRTENHVLAVVVGK
eukprot:m.174664 g.174664  ORF g.174664 m.174664 type:complete len:576 (+) comp18330_c0_seq2:1172-2899(+)